MIRTALSPFFEAKKEPNRVVAKCQETLSKVLQHLKFEMTEMACLINKIFSLRQKRDSSLARVELLLMEKLHVPGFAVGSKLRERILVLQTAACSKATKIEKLPAILSNPKKVDVETEWQQTRLKLDTKINRVAKFRGLDL